MQNKMFQLMSCSIINTSKLIKILNCFLYVAFCSVQMKDQSFCHRFYLSASQSVLLFFSNEREVPKKTTWTPIIGIKEPTKAL